MLYSFFFSPLEFSLSFLIFRCISCVLLASQNWCSIKNLLYLHLKDLPFLNGTLPKCLGNLTGLGALWIANTALEGEIPWSEWMPLFGEQGNIINTGLQFYIENNPGLFGRATPEEFPLVCNVQKFEIINQLGLSGNLSSTISRCRMKMLDITDVSLTGDLPLEICEICTLEDLIISGTNLSQTSIDAFNSQCNITQHIDLCISKNKTKDLPEGRKFLKYTWEVS